MSLLARFLLCIMICALLAACSSNGSESTPADGASGPGAVTDTSADGAAADTGPAAPKVTREVRRPLYDNRKYFLASYRPATCQGAKLCPGLVLVPPGLEAGETYFADGAEAVAAAIPAVVYVYNPPGRGEGPNKTGGEEDYNGVEHRGLLAEVLGQARRDSVIDENRVGVVSFGWGLAPAAALLHSSQGQAAHLAAFLVDVEGPVSRCDITTALVGPEASGGREHGAGLNDSRCGLCAGDCTAGAVGGACDCAPEAGVGGECGRRKMPLSCTAPEVDARAGVPASYVCHPDSEAMKAGAPACDDDGFWRDREPRLFLPRIVVHYLRIQFAFDHALPSRHSGRQAYQLTLSSEPGFVRQYNDLQPNQSLPSVPECAGICELSYQEGNGYGANPFLGHHPDYKPMTKEAFMEKVLPVFVKYMLGKI
jgi:hypothetical protein